METSWGTIMNRKCIGKDLQIPYMKVNKRTIQRSKKEYIYIQNNSLKYKPGMRTQKFWTHAIQLQEIYHLCALLCPDNQSVQNAQSRSQAKRQRKHWRLRRQSQSYISTHVYIHSYIHTYIQQGAGTGFCSLINKQSPLLRE